ncbi:MAG: peptidase M64 [bacterium]|jgi:hypothetical protein|nr:peptidase M64 [bacterium]MBK9778066.1 peptidase M64 [bacterium]
MSFRRILSLALLALLPALPVATAHAAGPSFADLFADTTLRVDLNHTGNADEEIVALDRLHLDGPWAGPRVKLVDTLELGRYRARLLDAATGELLWSRGFDSYFGEWKTTGPAGEGVRRTYHESVRCPLPLREAVLALDHRGADNTLREVFRTSIDPQSPELRREPLADDLVTVEAHVGGGTAECVDVVILGEGYTKDDTAKFEADVRRFADALLGREPFASLKRRVSVRGVLKPSQDRGCDEPTRGVHRQTALGCTFNSLGSERYLLTEDNRAIREVARAVPYDVLSIMVNHTRYGGGGIYNLFNTFTSDNQWSGYVFVHEFGHGFAGLADEYYSSSTAYTDFYPAGFEPVERNITRLLDGKPKWAGLVGAGVPVPTPWAKAEHDAMDADYQKQRGELDALIAKLMTSGAPQAESDAAILESEDLSREHQQRLDAWFAKQPQAGQVGAFEGAGYCTSGVFRSQLDCIMFSKGLKDFCAACGAGIREVIEASTDQPAATEK